MWAETGSGAVYNFDIVPGDDPEAAGAQAGTQDIPLDWAYFKDLIRQKEEALWNSVK